MSCNTALMSYGWHSEKHFIIFNHYCPVKIKKELATNLPAGRLGHENTKPACRQTGNTK